jgi:hypothetical protein
VCFQKSFRQSFGKFFAAFHRNKSFAHTNNYTPKKPLVQAYFLRLTAFGKTALNCGVFHEAAREFVASIIFCQ